MSDYDSDSASEASLGETINVVEECISKLSKLEREKFLIFKVPSAEEAERQEIWLQYDIQEQVCTEDLAELLHRLAGAQRDQSWFTWLKWVLFGH